MASTITFYYDFLSPYSYLASTQLQALAERVDAIVAYKPIHVLQLMDMVSNHPTTVLCEAKLAYAFEDLARWAAVYDVPITPNPHLKEIDVTPLLLGALAAEQQGAIEAYTTAVFSAYWTKQAAFNNSDELLAILAEASIAEPDKIVAASSAQQKHLEANIEEAVQRGVFGVPSFVCETGLYFGNDRLTFLEHSLAEARA